MTRAIKKQPAMMDVEARTIRKTTVRIIPLLVVCYVAAYLDRVNVGFAAPSMSKDLHLSATAYGLGAGIFFLTYFSFEIPSNLLLVKVGARKWIARIMLSWGILSGMMAFVTGAHSFYVVRLLLGLAEAGFFPGVIFYLTLWFPKARRARMMGLFILAIPLSSVVGAPLSSVALGLNGTLGLHGWQWLFLVEAVPAVLLAAVVFFMLSDSPADAAWLSGEEREWLRQRLQDERSLEVDNGHHSLVKGLLNPRILLLGVAYFGATAGLYALSFYLPTIVKGFGLTLTQNGLVLAVPYIAGAVGMVVWSRHSDLRQERKYHAAAALILATAGIAASTFFPGPLGKMVAISVASLGIFAGLPIIWTLPNRFLAGPAVAGGIALINSIGNLSGFGGTYAIGWIKDRTGSYTDGLLLIAALSLVSAVIVLLLPVRDAGESRATATATATEL